MNRLSSPADYAGPRFVTDTRDAVGEFPDLYDSLEHQRRLTEIAAKRRRSNVVRSIAFTTIIAVPLIIFGLLGLSYVAPDHLAAVLAVFS